jgi:hypothetical protein
VCTFDIVPSLGPQSQVLYPAEASVFVQSSILSTRSAIDTHHKYRLLNYSSTKVPTGTVWHPPQVLVTHHRCSQDHAQHTIFGSQSEDKRKGSAQPHCNLITNSHICGGIFQQARTITSYILIPQISLIVVIAYNNSFLSMGIKKYGK